MENIDFKKVKGIIFDYGGTIDTRGVHWSEVIWDAYQKAQVLITKEQFRDAYVFAERELARTRHILPEHDFHDLLLIKMRIELQYLAASQFIPSELIDPKSREIAKYCYEAARQCVDEAKPVLKALYKEYPMVLVSNFYGNVEAVLKDFGIRQYFQKIIESAVVGIRKPDPRIFELGCEALGISPDHTLVVGDSYKKDIQPAESIGCQVLWLKGKGWTAAEDAQLHPNIIASLSDILALMLR